MPTKKIVFDGRADMPGGTGWFYEFVPCNCKGRIPGHSATEAHQRPTQTFMEQGKVYEFDPDEQGLCLCGGKIGGHDIFEHEGESDKARYIKGYIARGEAHEVPETQ